MLKFDLRVKLGRVTSGAKITVRAFNYVFENGDYPEIWSHGIIPGKPNLQSRWNALSGKLP